MGSGAAFAPLLTHQRSCFGSSRRGPPGKYQRTARLGRPPQATGAGEDRKRGAAAHHCLAASKLGRRRQPGRMATPPAWPSQRPGLTWQDGRERERARRAGTGRRDAAAVRAQFSRVAGIPDAGMEKHGSCLCLPVWEIRRLRFPSAPANKTNRPSLDSPTSGTSSSSPAGSW